MSDESAAPAKPEVNQDWSLLTRRQRRDARTALRWLSRGYKNAEKQAKMKDYSHVRRPA